MNNTAAVFYPQVQDLCIRRIKQSFNPQRQLFDRLLSGNENWLTTDDTEDASSSLMVLLALHRANIPLDILDINEDDVFKAILELFYQPDYLQNLGLLFWVHAVYDKSNVHDLLLQLQLNFTDVITLCQQIKTSEVAWLLLGISHALLREDNPKLQVFSQQIFDILIQRFNENSHLFYHTDSKAPLKSRLRRHIGTFADQIYSIQALSCAKLVDLDPSGLTIAKRCANKIIALQGNKGQWWWHYNAKTGQVAQPYPVYSVHQHGMAPMGLMTLKLACDTNYESALQHSRDWLKDNELGVDMWDENINTFWRDIEYDQGRLKDFSRKAASVTGLSLLNNNLNVKLKLNRVTWPYEWAWCLYAGAIANHPQVDGHLI